MKVEAVIFDFDGVWTDNKVIVDENGKESVVCDRGDGLGVLELMNRCAIPVLVLSKEKNGVVRARCTKLQVPYLHGIDHKLPYLISWLRRNNVDPLNAVYVGNDINDSECMAFVGLSVCPKDAHPEILRLAKVVLEHNGGHGAVREVCDRIIARTLE